MSQTLVVAFKTLHNCLVNLPERWAFALSTQSSKRGGGVLVFRLTWGPDASKSAYVAWSGNPQTQNRQVRDHSGVLHENLLEIDSTHGQLLGLTEGTVVGVEFVSDIGVCTAAEVEVGGVDDWEILELNAGAVEDGLLRQARVVAVGQPLVFWLNASTHVRLVPRGMVPQAAVALLDNDSEVAVAPMVRRQQQPAPSAEEGRNTAAVSCLRVAGSGADDVLPSVVFVHPSSAVAQLCSARIGHGCMRAGASAADDAMWLAPWLAAVAIDARVQPGVLLAQTATLAHMGFAVGEVVRVGAVVKSMVDPPLALHFECFGEAVLGCEDVREALLPGGAGSQAVFGVGFCVAAGARLRSFCAAGEAVEPSECRETPLRVTRETLAQVVITVGGWPKGQKDGLNQPGQPDQPDQPDQLDQSELPGLGDFLALAWQSVEGALLGHGGGLLISGRRGSGKSSAAAALAHMAAHGQRSRLVHSRRIDCAALALDPRTSSARDALRQAIATARANAPSLLVLDDLDALLPAAADEQNGSASNARRVHVLADTMELLLAGAGHVAVVATATGGRAQVHARLFACGVLRDALELPAPDRAARERILDKIARRSATPPAAAFGAAAYASEGFLPGDLAAVYARAAHEATMRVLANGSGDDVRVTASDLQRALAGFKPRAMRGVQTQTSTTRWADIGGLADTRRQLRETLELPTRYAAVFASSPLRLRSGILLYGFPGCGKTMLASAVARECGLNFIGVKGPELLSKYIGSSEQAVRDLFARAAAAAPCVLFFDEFDAIAPRRGHDNTGVTDRVVNQFLTEMDGAEGLHGVYVLAATSRPDLIDPALLRPGRLDKAFLCAMPGAQDRAAILERHAAKITVGAAVDWVTLAGRTERFTGADLQALVYNAFLEAVHERVDLASSQARDSYESGVLAEFALIGAGGENTLTPVERALVAERVRRLLMLTTDATATAPDADAVTATAAQPSQSPQSSLGVPVVTAAHFDAALASTQSSLADQDRERFAAIYSDFVNDKKPIKKGPIEQHATMA